MLADTWVQLKYMSEMMHTGGPKEELDEGSMMVALDAISVFISSVSLSPMLFATCFNSMKL